MNLQEYSLGRKKASPSEKAVTRKKLFWFIGFIFISLLQAIRYAFRFLNIQSHLKSI